MTEESVKTMCPHCHRPWTEHSFIEAVDCIYTGAPTVDGTPWDHETTKRVAERFFRRLEE